MCGNSPSTHPTYNSYELRGENVFRKSVTALDKEALVYLHQKVSSLLYGLIGGNEEFDKSAKYKSNLKVSMQLFSSLDL